MTVIAAIADGTSCWIGGDSAAISGQNVRLIADGKVFTNGPYAFGICGSARMGQLLHYALKPPPPPADGDLQAFMCTEWADAVRECFKDGGWARKSDEQEEGGNFVVGVAGRLFEVWSDYQVMAYQSPYVATGCGEDYAMGSLHTTSQIAKAMLPGYRLELAMKAAAEFSTGVRPPFKIVSVTAAVAAEAAA